MATPGKRAFWMHQAAEYLIGGAFVASGLQSPEPMVPTLMGGLVMLNTACSKGPLAAFRVFGKRTHRLLDAVLIVLIIVAAVQPAIDIDNGTRGIMVLLAVCMGVIWMQSDFAEHAKGPSRFAGLGRNRAERAAAGASSAGSTSSGASGGSGASGASSAARAPSAPDGSTADTIGRTAGRLAGKGVNIYRSRKASAERKDGTSR